MSWHKRLRNFLRSDRLTNDIEREMSFHIAERAEAYRASGMSEAAALNAARRKFGNRTAQVERTRDADIITWLDSVRGDVRYALRALRRSPIFAVVAVASLALGIGANTAIYALIDAVMLRPLPVWQPESLVHVVRNPEDRDGIFTNPLWEEIRDRQTGFESIAAFADAEMNLASGGEPRRLRGSWVSGDYFRVFALQPVVGRLINRSDDVRGCRGIAVLGYDYWKSEYGSRADAVGKILTFEGQPFEIVGVAPAGFNGPDVGREDQFYAPICANATLPGRRSLDNRSMWWLQVMGRLQPGVSVEQVRTRLMTIAPAVYAATIPPNWFDHDKLEYVKGRLHAVAAPRGLSILRARYSESLTILMGAVALVLLIACANVANLLLARATMRGREVAVRLAIGAGRTRLVRQLLTESVLLALFGAFGGVLLAPWAMRGLLTLISSERDPITLDLAINAQVLGFAVAVAVITAIIFGLIPALRGTRVSPQAVLKTNARNLAEGHGRFTVAKVLVAAQVALSLTLLVGAGLLIGSLRNLTTLNPGFRADGVLLADVDLARTGIPEGQLASARRQILDRVRAIPGVRSASAAEITPVGFSSWNDIVVIDGFEPATFEDGVVWFNEVSEGYFTTLGTRLLAGRDFDESDVVGAAKTAIINDAMAKKMFAGKSPLGQQLRTKGADSLSTPYTIVGVVETAKYRDLREEESGTVYLPALQNAAPSPDFNVHIRADGDLWSLIPAVKAAILELNGATAVEFTSFSNQIASSLRRERLLAILSGLFGAVALALSMLGLYGVMAYTVTRRRGEIGVRIALGAASGRVLRMILGDVARMVAIGLVIGAAGAFASGRLVRSFLFGLEPEDPTVMALAAAVLSGVALLAGFLPAWRASRVDPVAALRED
ncbi:MAG TPA: ABC transporter permease [Gemmatimonadaceae bacterium]|nr:ABC transporter permease [Gemmatimonadaceae bacterium]